VRAKNNSNPHEQSFLSRSFECYILTFNEYGFTEILNSYSKRFISMNQVDIFTYYENKFDRITYQSDLFFGYLILTILVIFFGIWIEWIPVGNGGVLFTVLLLFTLSWIYTNARRRGCGILKAMMFALVALINPVLGGLIYFLFRPGELVITALPPAPISTWPVFSGPIWIFTRAPFRFLMKLALWLMGLTFIIIAIWDIFRTGN